MQTLFPLSPPSPKCVSGVDRSVDSEGGDTLQICTRTSNNQPSASTTLTHDCIYKLLYTLEPPARTLHSTRTDLIALPRIGGGSAHECVHAKGPHKRNCAPYGATVMVHANAHTNVRTHNILHSHSWYTFGYRERDRTHSRNHTHHPESCKTSKQMNAVWNQWVSTLSFFWWTHISSIFVSNINIRATS